jgi:hypothetical protein
VFENSNDNYVGHRLLFAQTQEQATAAFLDISNTEVFKVLRTTWLRGLLLAVCVTPVAIVLMIMASSMGSDGGGLFSFLAVLLWLVAWSVPWFLRDHVYAGNWELSVEDQHEAAESAFVLTYQRLERKALPASLEPRLIRSIIGGPVRYYLCVRQGRYVAFISALPYGTDLFVSWSLWREQVPIAMVWRWLVEHLSSVVGQGSMFHQIARSDPARAMRETVHNATRAGVEAAVEGHRATVLGTFGGLAPESVDDRFALVLGPVPVAMAPGPGPGPGTGPGPGPGDWAPPPMPPDPPAPSSN